MRSVLQQSFDFMFVTQVQKDLGKRAEEPKKKVTRTDKGEEKNAFEKMLDTEIRSLA
ncbi:MAG: hypothetical protein K6A74_05145 [Lachnospiraceae bacterium]|nr:hypothetical protein [Lachnospiraceae bacterium]